MLRLIATHLVLRVCHLIGGAPDGGIVLLQLLLQFGDFQNRHQLPFFYTGPIIDQKLLHVARLFGVNVDLLKRHEFGGKRQAPG